MDSRPRIRHIAGNPPPYPLNHFPADFSQELGKRIIYELCVSLAPKIEGSLWEKMFADCIGAHWVNSPVELDDVRLQNCAWSGKAVYGLPETSKTVRLISGRNNLHYSYGEKASPESDPDKIGKMVLDIWNARVSGVRQYHEHLRTVVLIRSPLVTKIKGTVTDKDHLTFAVFEKDTHLYIPEQFRWEWNKNGNLTGFSLLEGKRQYFTWQVNGQQFTIHDTVPQDRLCFKIKRPPRLDVDRTLQSINFSRDWITEFTPSGVSDITKDDDEQDTDF